MVRFTWPRLNERIYNVYGANGLDGSDNGNLYSMILPASDYHHLFARNLVIVIAIALLIAIIWVTMRFFDLFKTNGKVVSRRQTGLCKSPAGKKDEP